MRIKRGVASHRKHKKLFESVKGYRMTKNRLVKVAKEAQLHAGEYAFAGRRKKKSVMRRLWISRIGEAVKQKGISYSVFVANLKKANIQLDRKVLSFLVEHDASAFQKVLDSAKSV